MGKSNLFIILVTSIIPIAIGSIWYGPLFGKKWRSGIGLTKEDLAGKRIDKILAIAFGASMLMAFFLQSMIELVHIDVVDGQLGSASTHPFLHGAFYGVFWSSFTIIPALLIIGLIEERNWSNFFIHAGYWIVCWAIMGGLVNVWT